MRIFVPFRVADLSQSEISRRLVHGVNRRLSAAFPGEDEEGLEYVATLAAADDSLRMLDPAGHDGFRRVVGVVEVSNSVLALPDSGEDVLETGIYLEAPLPLDQFESFLVDEPGSEELVARALAGDESAFTQTEEIELLWYDAVERETLMHELQAEK